MRRRLPVFNPERPENIKIASCHLDLVKCHREGKPRESPPRCSVGTSLYLKATKGLRHDATGALESRAIRA